MSVMANSQKNGSDNGKNNTTFDCIIQRGIVTCPQKSEITSDQVPLIQKTI